MPAAKRRATSPDPTVKRRAKRVAAPPMPSYSINRENGEEERLFAGWAREMDTRMENTTRIKISSYDLSRALLGRRQLVPKTPQAELDYTGADLNGLYIFTDKNDHEIAVAWFNAFSNRAADQLYFTLMDYHEAAHVKEPTKAGADGQRSNPANYVTGDDVSTGLAKITAMWTAVGQPHSAPVVASGVIASGTSFAATIQLFENLRPLSFKVNGLFERVDPKGFRACVEAREEALRRRADFRALTRDDILVMEGREVMWNRKSAKHKDRSDNKRLWAILKALFGDREARGGALKIHDLKLRLRYGHRDLLMIRGSLMDHEAEEWTQGQRIAVAHFTHATYMQYLGVEAPDPVE
uniref:Uncharacterized protein n=1 Tax=Mycena chlorophos TaxID=658473 RepID=A0ABQ0L4N5_MYCCL|nr:predicted protein [Mycena chlorophos]